MQLKDMSEEALKAAWLDLILIIENAQRGIMQIKNELDSRKKT